MEGSESLFDEAHRLELPAPGPRYSHYAFRYPAKFHPPVVRALLDRFVGADDVLLDNFCGSGTSLLEAAVSRRQSVGLDIDPVAVAVSTAKTRCYDEGLLDRDASTLVEVLSSLERPAADYDRYIFDDLSAAEFESAVAAGGLWLPRIPKLDHWFRRYVSIDLAVILRSIQAAEIDGSSRTLFTLAFASTIRNVSNADPVPVSGLEVTAHMKKKDAAGRRINPFETFRLVMAKTIAAVLSYSAHVMPEFEPTVIGGDATALPPTMPTQVDAVITSPPYHNAVDYYRRHQLEMYWLNLVESHEDRLELLPKYIGRHKIPKSHPRVQGDWAPGPVAEKWFQKIQAEDPSRATDFRHYIASMGESFAQLSGVLRAGGPIVLVVGESAWRGEQIPTGDLLAEVAEPHFNLDERLWYPIKNRYMSYSRHNGADIAHEHVLIFR